MTAGQLLWDCMYNCSIQVIIRGALLNAAPAPADDDDFDPEESPADMDFDDFEDNEGSLALVDDEADGMNDVDASGASVNTGQVDWCVPSSPCWHHQM